jgi:hypothetical protein
MFLNLTFAFKYTSLIIASGILNLMLAYFLCYKVLHIKCRYLLKDITSSLNIKTVALRKKNKTLP